MQPRQLTFKEAMANSNVKAVAEDLGLLRSTLYTASRKYVKQGNLSSNYLEICRYLAIKQDLDLWYLIFNEERPTYEQLLEEINERRST